MVIPRRLTLVLAGLVSLSFVSSALAEVSLTDRHVLQRNMRRARIHKAGAHNGAQPKATGSQALIDASGVQWFINTDITFSTSSSASGAASEASYTHAVAATTLSGGTVSSTLSDAYDGYNTLCLSLNNTVATCETGNANFVIYNQNGPATTECPGSSADRQVVFPTMTSGSLEISRKVYVPEGDSFARWLNSVKNTGAAPATVTFVIANNLGSDSNTRIVTSSNGNNVAEPSDTWVTTFQNYSGTTSSDPRLGHVLQGQGAPVPLAGVFFADGDDNPFWGYTMTLAPGETGSIVNFGVAQPSKAAAAAKSDALAGFPFPARQCLSSVELASVKNFAAGLSYFATAPCRVFDSRSGSPLAAGSQTPVPVVGQCGIPPNATAVALNVTVISPTAKGHLRVFANGGPIPPTATLNYSAGQTRSNNAVAELGAAGALAVTVNQASGTAHVVFDVQGYFAGVP